MKKAAFFFIISLILISCAVISKDEMNLCKAMGLGKTDVIYIKKMTDEKITELIINSPYMENNNVKGINIYTSFDKTDETRRLLSSRFKERGYLVFLAGEFYNYDNRKNVLGIIQSNDQYDIIRIQKTADTERDITTLMIIERLKKWEQICRFTITGAGSYWIKARFIEKPADMKEFSHEITDFCPELLNDGTGKIEDLIAGMERDNSFYLIFY
ncbi:MAG: DUF4253 domain-containing protein [Spirochaetales bacterium]|nr:DUF4253 domain-containing protein [Spirochaetales bacterium]